MGFQPCTKSIEISGIASGREAAEALGTRGWGRRGSPLTSRRDVNDLMNVRFVLLTFFQIHCWLYIYIYIKIKYPIDLYSLLDTHVGWVEPQSPW